MLILMRILAKGVVIEVFDAGHDADGFVVLREMTDVSGHEARRAGRGHEFYIR